MSAPQAMAPQSLHAAVHWRVEPPFAMDAPDMGAQIELAGRLAGRQIAETLRATGFEAEALVVTSTVITAAITMQHEGGERFHDAIEAACGLRPEGILNAYMCTGWGFALRHYMRHTGVQRLAVAIIDLDPHNLAWQQCHPVIGRSGFGVTTLLFTLPAEPEARAGVPRCSGPHANSAFTDFVMALKLHQARQGVQPTFIPFMLDALALTAERLLAKGSLGPNRNAQWGHCFGADPWIGIIEWFGEHGLADPVRVIAGAIAYNGYYCFAPIALDARTRLEFRRFAGDTAALEREMGRPFPHHPRTSRDAMHARSRSTEEISTHA